MSKLSSFGKSLKGLATISDRLSAALEDQIVNVISVGSIGLGNVSITGGTIDGVVIGKDEPGPVYTTILQVGHPGTGYDVYFYGSTTGEYAYWNSATGRWEVYGDLLVTGITDLGNLRFVGNIIESTNTNGDIILSPNGSGVIHLHGPIHQHTTSGNISFETNNGTYTLTTSGLTSLESVNNSISLTSALNSNWITKNGNITLQTGTVITTSIITHISTTVLGSVTITTSVASNLVVGDKISISGTNSTPNINGIYTVTSTPTSLTFKITATVTVQGTTGSFVKINDINLSATNNVNIPTNVNLTFGSGGTIVSNSSNLSINSNANIILTPTNAVTIPLDNKGLTFGTTGNASVYSNGTDLVVDTGSGKLNINGDIIVNGTVTTINSTTVTIDDPIFTLGGDTPPITNDNKDRGIEFRYYNGSSKLGFFGYDESIAAFTYIQDATNTNEVISGSPGPVVFGNITGTSLNLQNGNITNVNNFTTSTLIGNPDITISSRDINLTATRNVNIPNNIPLYFGSSSIKELSPCGLRITSGCNIYLTPNSSYNVILPSGNGIIFDESSSLTRIASLTSGELSVIATGNINLTTSTSIKVPQNIPIFFNTSRIYSDTSNNLVLNSTNDIQLTPTGTNVILADTKHFVLGNTTEYITSNSNVISIIGSNDIKIIPSSNLRLPTVTKLIFNLLTSTEYVSADNSNNITLAASGHISLVTNSYVSIPDSKNLIFSNSGNEYITGTTNTLTFTSGNTINLNASSTTLQGNLSVLGTSVSINDPIITIATNTVDNKDRGIEYRYTSGITNKLGFFGYKKTLNAFTFIPDATNTAEVESGNIGNAEFGNLILDNGTITSTTNPITLQGTAVVIPEGIPLEFPNSSRRIVSESPDLSVYVDTPGEFRVHGNMVVDGTLIASGLSAGSAFERLSVLGGGNINPSATLSITYISVTSSGIATGQMLSGSDGLMKYIFISSLASGATYELSFLASNNARLQDPGTGNKDLDRKVQFTCPGHGIAMIYDSVLQAYMIINGGGKVINL